MATEKTEDRAKIKLRNTRLSFPALFTPKPPKADKDGVARGKPSYQSNFLIPFTDKKQIALVEDAIDYAISEWERKNPKAGRFPDLDDLSKNEKCWRSGENKRGEPLYDGYEGCMVLAARNSKRPPVIDADKTPLIEDDGKPYAGCYVNPIVRIWIQDNENGLALRCSLEAVQFYRDGEAFGAAPVDTDSEFEDESEGGDSRSSSRRGRDREESDDEKPRSRRGRGEEEEEAPRSRRGRDEEEVPRRRSRDDEEDQPRRRGRGSDEDLV